MGPPAIIEVVVAAAPGVSVQAKDNLLMAACRGPEDNINMRIRQNSLSGIPPVRWASFKQDVWIWYSLLGWIGLCFKVQEPTDSCT